jgi:hypothetical protein
MRFSIASEPTPGRVNEDYAIVGQDWAAVLDGATAVKPDRNGCIHDVPWFVRQLVGGLTGTLVARSDIPLTDALAAAISSAMAAHESTCDLANPDSPSSTVTILRRRGVYLDYLVLGDSPLLLDHGGGVQSITDDRMANLSDYSYSAVIAAQNSPGGYYVASTLPEAAHQALHGSISASDVAGAALLTDGASRLVEFFDVWDWQDLFRSLREKGPADVIARTRRAESERIGRDDGRLRKHHDDASIILIEADNFTR